MIRDKIAAYAVDTDELNSDAVITSKLADGAVTSFMFADNADTSEKAAGSISMTHPVLHFAHLFADEDRPEHVNARKWLAMMLWGPNNTHNTSWFMVGYPIR